MNLASAFVQSAEKNGDRPALFWGDREYSYQSILGQATRLAAHLRDECGIKPGDRVALWLKNCPEFVPSLFGILLSGAAVVPINNFLKPTEVAYILKDAGIDLIITEPDLAAHAESLQRERPSLRFWTVDQFESLAPARGAAREQPGYLREDSDLAVVIYTSGTTGRPKGAMLSHGNLLHNVESCRQVLEAVEFDRFVVILPLFHSFMLCVGLLLPLLVGGSLVLIKSLHPPKNVFLEIIHRQATILPAIPQFFRALAASPVPEGFPLRLCISGGAPLPVEILREFNARMPIPLIEGYGLSEASPVVSLNPVRGLKKEGSIGRPIPDVEVTVQTDAGEILPVGQIGEICVRGGNVMLGYWNQPEETARALRDGWLFTGDIGYQDEDGYFFITDRKKDMLLVNGINVYPREIEEVLYRYPGIREAAVVGISDSRKGEQPIGFVSAEEGVVLEERLVIHFLREQLADFKVPRKIVALPALPRNATGKILKTALREQAQSLLRPETSA